MRIAAKFAILVITLGTIFVTCISWHHTFSGLIKLTFNLTFIFSPAAPVAHPDMQKNWFHNARRKGQSCESRRGQDRQDACLPCEYQPGGNIRAEAVPSRDALCRTQYRDEFFFGPVKNSFCSTAGTSNPPFPLAYNNNNYYHSYY